jgi:hypothetical protein
MQHRRIAIALLSPRILLLNPCALFLVGLVAFANIAAAKPVVLHCRGHQVGSDQHALTDQIITLDMEKNAVVSIELLGKGPKDTINAPIEVSKKELRWTYGALNFKYVFNRDSSALQISASPAGLLGTFDCETKDKI